MCVILYSRLNSFKLMRKNVLLTFIVVYRNAIKMIFSVLFLCGRKFWQKIFKKWRFQDEIEKRIIRLSKCLVQEGSL